MLRAMTRPRSDLRPRRHADLPAWYGRVLAEHRASGLSLSEFAEVLGISPRTLARWRQRLAGEAEATGAASSTPLPEAMPHRLVEVRPALDSSTRSTPGSLGTITIRLAGERRIEVEPGFDAAELQRLVRVLEAC